MAVTRAAGIDMAKVDELIAEEERALEPKHPKSIAFRATAEKHVAGGVASSWQDAPPHTVYVTEGKGSKIWDLDGNEYVDYHNGYGVMVVGHAHPKIVKAVQERVQGHALRSARAGDRSGRGEPRGTLQAPALALRELRHGGDARRRPADARRERPRPSDQDR